ncbi:MAG: leucine-rich repeat domain-containing protein [Muribaculaceae bacterium]|nr:leucine-rich repeat domain-containing protein [Muribaculaceae bacterium]
MKKFFTLLFTLLLVASSYASTKIGDLYYNLNESAGTAEVTYLSENNFDNIKYVSGAVTIPETVVSGGKTYRVTSIGDNAFSLCKEMTSVSIPSSVTSIGNVAFHNCYGLETVVIPNSVTTIGNQAFGACSSLKSVTLSSSLKSMGFSAFESSALTSVVIPNTLTEIPDHAFYSCYSLSSVTIPGSVKSIGDQAFRYCIELGRVDIPSSVTSIGYAAFDYCSKMQAIEVAPGNSNFCSVDGVLFSADKTQLLAFPGGLAIDYTVPSTVTEIGEVAFCQNRVLKSVTIPNSVQEIGDAAFWYCAGLTSLTIPESVTKIGEVAFIGCEGLQSINVAPGNSNYCSVDGVLFSADKKQLLAFPAAVGGDYTIPSSVTEIGIEAFAFATGLKSVTFPNSLRTIGMQAFYECWGLENIEIPAKVTEIGDYAFYECKSLKSITFNSKKDFNLGTGVFFYCNAIEKIRLYSPTPPTTDGSYLFSSEIYPVAELYVPGTSRLDYGKTLPWSNFTNLIGFYVVDDGVDDDDNDDDDTEAVEAVTFDTVVNADVYTTSGLLVVRNASEQEVRALAPGLYIIGGKKVVIR